MGKKGDVERTCRRCGHVWLLPKAIAMQKATKQAKAVGWATPVAGKRRQEIRMERALVDQSNRDLAMAQACPACGSSDVVAGRPPAARAVVRTGPPAKGWYPDPWGRFAQRWWGGAAWTEHVTGADGSRATDPL